jgi:hypothetical protein
MMIEIKNRTFDIVAYPDRNYYKLVETTGDETKEIQISLEEIKKIVVMCLSAEEIKESLELKEKFASVK